MKPSKIIDFSFPGDRLSPAPKIPLTACYARQKVVYKAGNLPAEQSKHDVTGVLKKYAIEFTSRQAAWFGNLFVLDSKDSRWDEWQAKNLSY